MVICRATLVVALSDAVPNRGDHRGRPYSIAAFHDALMLSYWLKRSG
jgi:hypothetical protein